MKWIYFLSLLNNIFNFEHICKHGKEETFEMKYLPQNENERILAYTPLTDTTAKPIRIKFVVDDTIDNTKDVAQ